MRSDPGFQIRVWPSDMREAHEDFPGGHSLADAIEKARQMASDKDKHYRQVMVMDPFSTRWAEFTALWLIDEAHR
jgi:hypothetical protein